MLRYRVLLECQGTTAINETQQIPYGNASIEYIATDENIDGSIKSELTSALVKQCIYVVVTVDYSDAMVARDKDVLYLIKYIIKCRERDGDELLVASFLARRSKVIITLLQHVLYILGQ